MRTKKKETGLTKELYETIIYIVDERVRSIKVGREEYDKLRDVVYELAQAQKRTEERVEELAQAQKRTEERVEELAQAQKRTEERVEELAQAQKRTEERVEELAQAQKRTEDAIQQLSRAVASLSDTIGFGLEDIARVVLPGYLERHFKIKIEELERKFFVVDSREIEINLYAEGEREGKSLVVIGECRSRIYERDVDSFYTNVEPLIKTIDKEKVLVLFGYLIHPSASRKAEERNIILVASYQR